MKKIAHRGLKIDGAQENSLAAFDNAVKANYDGIELDVRKTKDDNLILSHSAFIKGKLINLLNLSEIEKIKNDKQIIKLSEVLSRYKCLKLVELKERVDISKIENLVDDNTYFTSFDTKYLIELKEKYPNFKFASLNYIFNSVSNYNLDGICILESLMTKKIEQYFLKRNIKIFIYGIGKKITYFTDTDNCYYIIDF